MQFTHHELPNFTIRIKRLSREDIERAMQPNRSKRMEQFPKENVLIENRTARSRSKRGNERKYI